MSWLPALCRRKRVHFRIRSRVDQAVYRRFRAQIAQPKQTDTTLPRLVGRTYVAHATGLSREDVWKLVERDKIPYVLDEGKPKFDVVEINGWLEARRIAAKTAPV